MHSLVWTNAARLRLAEILDYIAEFDEAAADDLNIRINSLIDKARHFPEMYRPGRVQGTREIVAHRNYLVIYSLTTDAIEVVAVIHARQAYP